MKPNTKETCFMVLINEELQTSLSIDIGESSEIVRADSVVYVQQIKKVTRLLKSLNVSNDTRIENLYVRGKFM